ncbi:cytochrome C assembly protein [Candidatus Laterigemmans baculatus]|uniref:cytochrome C assembly protein n=1 Tax=Candidatus Laterigemmans baculatus TaxID=2770505 RepID=UPI0013DCB23C|nr:cytochrome C assembly protein [Candidatus Laterigemmans baculatus]
MQQFLSGISVTCFVGSYLVALALELTRPLFRVPVRGVVTVGFIVAGLLSHLVYLVMLADPSATAAEIGLLAGWYSWSLLLAWAVAACYLVLFLRRPDTTIGYFLLPPVLGLIVLAMLVQDWEPFTRQRAAGFWRSMHGFSMLLGAAAVLLGFVAGVMFLVQSVRLKQKRPGSRGLRLPTLEWLQKLNRGCLVFSTGAVGLGTLAGVIMSLNESGSVAWTSRGIVLSFVLLIWLLAAVGIEFFYKPARQGRKVAYLTLASFGFLVLAMGGVLESNHGTKAGAQLSTGGKNLPEATPGTVGSAERTAARGEAAR